MVVLASSVAPDPELDAQSPVVGDRWILRQVKFDAGTLSSRPNLHVRWEWF